MQNIGKNGQKFEECSEEFEECPNPPVQKYPSIYQGPFLSVVRKQKHLIQIYAWMKETLLNLKSKERR